MSAKGCNLVSNPARWSHVYSVSNSHYKRAPIFLNPLPPLTTTPTQTQFRFHLSLAPLKNRSPTMNVTTLPQNPRRVAAGVSFKFPHNPLTVTTKQRNLSTFTPQLNAPPHFSVRKAWKCARKALAARPVAMPATAPMTSPCSLLRPPHVSPEIVLLILLLLMSQLPLQVTSPEE